MSQWWKNPVLQGPENDYGDYDYLIEKIPENREYWERDYDGDGRKCDSCGKYHKLNLYTSSYFHTLDGYDSLDYTECWVCVAKSKKHQIEYRMKKPFKKWYNYVMLARIYHNTKKASGIYGPHLWKESFKTAKHLIDDCRDVDIIRYIKQNKKKGVV